MKNHILLSNLGSYIRATNYLKLLLRLLKSYPKLLCFVIGILSNFAFAPYNIVLALIIAICALLFCIQVAPSVRQAGGIGLAFGFGHFLGGVYWVVFALNVYKEFLWATPFGLIGLPGILGFYICLVSVLSWYFRSNQIIYIYSFTCFWVIFEWLRSWVFTGFPWNLSGYALADYINIIQIADIIGIYGLSFILILFSSTCYLFLVHLNNKVFISQISFIVAVLFGLYLYGYFKLKDNPIAFKDISARIIQPSIAQSSKWEEKEFFRQMDLYISLSTKNLIQKDLIIWPEAAVTIPNDYPEVLSLIRRAIKDKDTILITGGITEEFMPGDYRLYSSMYGINQDKKILFRHYKSHLVPFGEYMPFKSFLPIKKLTYGLIDYTPGSGSKVYEITTKNGHLKFKPFICYEIIFPEEVRESNLNADVFINITNDAWYGDSSGPYQHFEMVKFRAIENGVPIISVSNNGISGVIDALGRFVITTKLDEVTYKDIFIPHVLKSETLYSKYGNIPVLSCVLFILLINLLYLFTFLRRNLSLIFSIFNI